MKVSLSLLFLAFAIRVTAQTEFDLDKDRFQLEESVTEDLSTFNQISMPEPRFAYVNLIGIRTIPSSKSTTYQGWLEFFDGSGRYFKKRVIIKGQGNYTARYIEKKNASILLCGNTYSDSDTPDIQFGEWIPQDSYHLKAFYTDFCRGIGEIGYKVFDRIRADREPYWKKGGYDNGSNARCYPDGFPCALYLDGNFQGVYAWQLKKSRRNMNQLKYEAKHIHLDGNLQDKYIFQGTVRWNQFEVRNPQNLYDKYGEEYYGNKPKELMSRTSISFNDSTDTDEIREDKLRTVQVRDYILKFSKYWQDLSTLMKEGNNVGTLKMEFEKRYDLESLIDYYVTYFLQFNCDGSLKNWQWFTYDGQKWMVTPYDLDQIFGINLYGVYRPATLPLSELTSGPFFWISKYYQNEIRERYYQLRESGAIDKEAIKEIAHDWVDRVGEYYYEKEISRWPDSPCYSDAVCAEGWEVCNDWDLYANASNFVENTMYSQGDVCKYEGRLWRATMNVTSSQPYIKNSNKDDMDRLDGWIDDRIDYLDAYWGYTPNSIASVPNESARMVEGIYTLDGKRTLESVSGINIIRYSDGTTRKVFIK